jgi:hypothetical protein
VDVETKNSCYHIEWLGGSAIRISGHPEYCPTPVDGKLQGSSNKEGVLEPGLIGRGMHLRFVVDERRPVTTSRVMRVRVKRAPTPPPSVH